MDYKYICIECRNTFEPEFNKLKCTSGDCEYLDTSCYDIIFEEYNLPIKFESFSLGEVIHLQLMLAKNFQKFYLQI